MMRRGLGTAVRESGHTWKSCSARSSTMQYGTLDRATTWLVDKLLMAPFFYVCKAVDRAFADLGTVD